MSTEAPAAPAQPQATTTRPPTLAERVFDRAFRTATWVLAWGGVALLVMIVLEIGKEALPAFKEHGVGLVTSSEWNPSKKEVIRDPATGEIDERDDPKFGLAAPIFGTIY